MASYIGSPVKMSVATSLSEANYVQTKDMDGDSDIDIVGTAFDSNMISWWENTKGDGTEWVEHSIDDAVDGVVFALVIDLDEDEDPDVVGASWNGDYISWWENTDGAGTTWSEYSVNSSIDEPTCLDAADIDDDGDIDLFSASHGSPGEITWWENTQDSNPSGWKNSWTKHTIKSGYTEAYWVSIGDVTGDGVLDVVGASGGLDKFSFWKNDGTMPDDGTPWNETPIRDSLDLAISIELSDFDGDGNLDVVGAVMGADTIAWFENAGDGLAWTMYTLRDDFDYAITVATGDVDSDGDADILGCARDSDAIVCWENSAGDASVWIPHEVTTSFDGARWVAAGDIDGDGFLDVVGAGINTSDEIAWWKIIE